MAALRAPPQRPLPRADRAGAAGGGRGRPRRTRPCSSSAAATTSCCAWTAAARGTSRAADDGAYAGHHPADSREAIARLEAQRAAGAEYIVFPAHRNLVAGALRGASAAPRRPLPRELLRPRDLRDLRPQRETRDERADDRLHPRHAPQRDLAGGAGAERARARPRPRGAPDAARARPTRPATGRAGRSRRSTTRSSRASGAAGAEPPELAAGLGAQLRARRRCAREARELVEADFSRLRAVGLQGPAQLAHAPFWQRILPPMRYVICLRNPVDVAASLEARKDEPVPFEQGVELWLTYVRAALAATAGHPRGARLLRGPDGGSGAGRRPAGPLHRSRRSDDDAEAEVARRDRRRASARACGTTGPPYPTSSTPRGVPFHVKALYLALRQFVPGAESVETEVLDLLGHYADSAGRRLAKFAAVQTEVEQLRERVQGLERDTSRRLEQTARRASLSSRRSSTRRGPSCGGCRRRTRPQHPSPTRRPRGCRRRRRRGPRRSPRFGRGRRRGDPSGGDRARRREGRRRAARARRLPRLAFPDGGGRSLPRLSPLRRHGRDRAARGAAGARRRPPPSASASRASPIVGVVSRSNAARSRRRSSSAPMNRSTS